ncbi:MAG: cyclase family protein [Streptosporangiales bacterium]|nr:cyclase family protein [Streptosporangiales bacterium]
MSGLQVYELSHVFENSMPHYWAVPPFQHLYKSRLGETVREHGITVASDIVVASLHTGTHIDAFSHVHVVGGGPDAPEPGPGGDELPILLRRGVLIDCRDAVSAGHVELSRSLLGEVVAERGLKLAAGDVVLVATGWDRHWPDQELYSGRNARPPGVTVDGATYLLEHGPVAVGADTPTLEPVTTGLQVHRLLLSERRVHIIENLLLSKLADAGLASFVFAALPLRIRGATGSPLRAVALAGPSLPELVRLLPDGAA